MADLADAVNDAVEKARESKLNAAVAALVAITATFMALCNVKDGNVVQAMQAAQANSVDTWAYYQAKSTKQNLAEQMVDQLGIEREVGGAALSAEASAVLTRKIGEYTAKARQYEAEKNEIKAKAEGYQKEYDGLNVHDDQFDIAEAAASVSIALFGVTALTQKRWLLVVGCVFASFGFILGAAGFLNWTLHPDFIARLLS
ncbi:MAG: DUF4337 domain-containing protein [Minicystis sp.]